MGFNIRGGDKSSLALLSSKRGRAYARTRADEAFALPSFSDAMPLAAAEPQHQSNSILRQEQPDDHDAENVKQTMLQHESVFKEQLHELHRLYQKQCMLMAESKKGPGFDRPPEPPSSNSSFLCNPDTLKHQEQRSFGDASFTKACDTNQTYRALLHRMDDIKHMEDGGSSRKQISHRSFEVSDLDRKPSSRLMFDLEQPAANCAILDLERPADECMDVEVQEEKPQIAGLNFKSADAFASGHVYLPGSNKEGEKRELFIRESRGSSDSKLFGYQITNDTRIYQNPRDSQEEILKGCLQEKEVSSKGLPLTEMSHFQMGPAVSLAYSKDESVLYPKEASSSSGRYRGLPDLNGDVNITTEQQVSPIQTFSQKTIKDHHYIDLEVDSRSCSTTSKLPHWLCQAPSTRPLPMHVSTQTSVCQSKPSLYFLQDHDKTMRTSHFLPEVHDKGSWCSNLPMDTKKALFTQEPSCSWSQGTKDFAQGEVSFWEPHRPFSSQYFHHANTTMAEGSYTGLHGRESINGGIPFFVPQASAKVGLGTTSASSFANVAGSQLEFGISGPSAEPLSSVRSEGPATMSLWYQQRESFSSLMQQASNPDPFYNKLVPVTSVNPWDTDFSREGTLLAVEPLNRGICGLLTHVDNTEVFPSHVKCTALSSAFDSMHTCSEHQGTLDSGMKGRQITSDNHLEISSFIEQAGEGSKGSNYGDLNSRKSLFDLNVSIDDCMLEGNLDVCNVISGSGQSNQQQSLKQEAEMSRSLGWHTPQMYEQQRESVAANGTASEIPTVNTNATDLHNEASPLSKAAEVFSSHVDMLRNDTFADYCSGEEEIGGGFVRVKSSDSSGLTSCESRDAVHMELIKARDDSNTSSGEACHSHESRMVNHKGDFVLSSSLQSSIGLPSQVNGVFGAQFESFFFPDSEIVGSSHDMKRGCLADNCMEFGDDSEAANVVAKKDVVETSEAAELLLSLGMDLPVMAGGDHAMKDSRKCLDWLADIIPHEDYCPTRDLDVEMAFRRKAECGRITEQGLDVPEAKVSDPFELAVLALKPADPDLECLATKPMDRGNAFENIPTLRRRPSRRGRAGKDFQKEMLRSIISLSRHEVTEDLQIIEGLIKSTAETVNSCSTSHDDKPLSGPEQGASRSLGKGKSMQSCRNRKLNGILNVCSWGESTRRKRMERQRSQWLSLPPGVRASLFPDNAGDVNA